MKKFDRDGRVNFVDVNNVFVGYDMGQDCCENADYLLSPMLPNGQSIYEADLEACPEEGLDSYIFDPTFIQTNTVSGLDQGNSVTFRMTSLDAEAEYCEVFLTLFNSHNGYYGHGFEFKIGDEVKESGTL